MPWVFSKNEKAEKIEGLNICGKTCVDVDAIKKAQSHQMCKSNRIEMLKQQQQKQKQNK